MLKKIGLIINVFLILFIVTGCSSYTTKMITLDNAFGSSITIQIVDKSNLLGDNKLTSMENDLNNIVKDLSNTFDTHSSNNTLLKQVNDNSGICEVRVNDDLLLVLEKSLEIAQLSIVDSKAMYDPTIGVVWSKWDFINNSYFEGSTKEGKIPTQEEIDELLPLVNYQNIVINKENKTVYLKEKGMELDLGSIAKGYAADKIKEYLISKDIKSGVINVGGNILLIGNNSSTNKGFKVKLKTPFISKLDSNYDDVIYFGTLYLENKTIVTSGIYERYIKYQDKMYHHILNPNTGLPIDNQVVSCVVITNSSILADALSTMLFTIGHVKGLEYANNTADLEVIYIVEENGNNKIYLSNEIKEEFIFNNELIKRGYIYG